MTGIEAEFEVVPGPDPQADPVETILVVDDEAPIREVLEEYLLGLGYRVQTARDGREALDFLRECDFDLVITDLVMPRMDGFALIRAAQEIRRTTPIVVLTGHGTMENAVQALRIGAYDFVVKPILDLAQLRISVARSLEKRRLQKLNHRYRRHLETMVGEQTERIIEQNRRLEGYALELETMSVSVISSLMTALEEKDGYTAGHSRRVTHYARAMAQELGLGPRLVWLVETAAALHDVGKLIVDVGFIKKKGPLSPEEWEIMRRHPVAADRFLAPFRFLDDVRPLIRRHHERLDGSGYPDGLGGPDLSLATQILAVADSYDAMTSRRSYRRTLKRGEAVTEMERVSGRHFKPEVIRALVAALDRLKAGSVME